MPIQVIDLVNNKLGQYVTEIKLTDVPLNTNPILFACPEYHGLVEEDGMTLELSTDVKHKCNFSGSDNFILGDTALKCVEGKTNFKIKFNFVNDYIYFRYFCSHKGTDSTEGTLFEIYDTFDSLIFRVYINFDRTYSFYGIQPDGTEYLIGTTSVPVMENKKGFITMFFSLRHTEVFLLEEDKNLLFVNKNAFTKSYENSIGSIIVKGQQENDPNPIYLSQFLVTSYEPSYQYLISHPANPTGDYGFPDFYQKHSALLTSTIDSKTKFYDNKYSGFANGNDLNSNTFHDLYPIDYNTFATFNGWEPHTWNFNYYKDVNGYVEYVANTVPNKEAGRNYLSNFKGGINTSGNVAGYRAPVYDGTEIVGIGLSFSIERINVNYRNKRSNFVFTTGFQTSLGTQVFEYPSSSLKLDRFKKVGYGFCSVSSTLNVFVSQSIIGTDKSYDTKPSFIGLGIRNYNSLSRLSFFLGFREETTKIV